MNFDPDRDEDLERRLRRIAQDPEPAVPARLVDYAASLAAGEADGRRVPLWIAAGRRGRQLFAVLAAAAAVAVAVTGGLLLGSLHDGVTPGLSPSASAALVGPTASPSASGGVATPAPSASGGLPTASPSAAPSGPQLRAFTTSGAASGWTGFSWTNLPAGSPLATRLSLVIWRGGYALYSTVADGPGASAAVWTSIDGSAWRRVDAIDAPGVLVAASPEGLVAVTMDPNAATGGSRVVWTSADGEAWQNRGRLNLPAGRLISLAGTTRGVVATLNTAPDIVVGDAVKAGVWFSTDGVAWTGEPVDTVGAWSVSNEPHVQAANDRFFLMGDLASPLASGAFRLASSSVASAVLWSDDGRTWTRSKGSFSDSAQSLDVGRAGLILHTTAIGAVPGGEGMARSTDGGKTWQPDNTFGPLEPAPCTGECSVGPAGLFGSNGSYIVAVRNGGKAWISTDGATWTPVAWDGPDHASGPDPASGVDWMTVLPRGIAAGGKYGAGH